MIGHGHPGLGQEGPTPPRVETHREFLASGGCDGGCDGRIDYLGCYFDADLYFARVWEPLVGVFLCRGCDAVLEVGCRGLLRPFARATAGSRPGKARKGD